MADKILIVDDDPSLVRLIRSMLEKAGYEAHEAGSADEAIALLKSKAVDLLLLDVDLPGISGLRLLELLKSEPRTAELPVIMITVKGEEADKLKGLKGGADDYLVKPFSYKELLARVEALLRRVSRAGKVSQVLEAGGITIDFDRHRVLAQGAEIELTRTEFDILSLFLKRKGIVLTYGNLVDSVSKKDRELSSGNLYVRIASLRKKLGKLGELIETVHGIGYRFSD